MSKKFFTSESVTVGHPDKICDTIADTILDNALIQDPDSHMAVEATIKDDFILIYGEANTKANLDYAKIAKQVLKDIGYEEEYDVMVKISSQSSEINEAVSNKEISAGDQGIMFGYATNETKEYMPLPILLAHKLAKQLEDVRKQEKNSILKPDGKSQVTIEYENNKVKRIDNIVISTQHVKEVSQEELSNFVIEKIIEPIIDKTLIDENTKYIINPSGSFTIGGSFGDSGTTGRKIVVDTYGGAGRIGGGCFSSKDPSKVDRSAAYYARYVAKSIVAANLCDTIEIHLSYAIGISKPLSIMIDTFNTNKINEDEILDIINKNFDFSVSNIINELDLKKPIYAKTASYGHFGREEFSWEKIKPIIK
ncbi:MAG: methionine adenosyltransferase [Erysipelotrichaceae bacterium]|nr:methionine adenosyltransferase [Erysipelotrichaceae bacterium]